MDNLTNITVVRKLLAKHGFHFSKSLGQNFLINPSVCPRMAEAAGAEGRCVLEIGPGIGVLTAELARCAETVVAVELDASLLPVLRETLAEFPNVQVVQGDAMKLDLAALIRETSGGRETVVCANLPYYITSPILMNLLETKPGIKAVTVMVQQEAARRLCAEPGTREAGAVTFAVHYYAQPEYLFPVSRGSFLPSPNVDSAVIRLTIRETPPVAVRDEKRLFACIRAAFGQRRKMLPNALSAGLRLPRPAVLAALEAAGIPATVRGENLTLADFARLADAIPESPDVPLR